MSRKESRMQAFQTLFQLEMKDTELTINEAINFIKDDEPELDFDFIHWLVTGVKDHEPVLDDTINEAVELAKQFSDDEHYKFINGVLSNIK